MEVYVDGTDNIDTEIGMNYNNLRGYVSWRN